MKDDYRHLIHIKSHDELSLYELIPDVVWIFDLDKHGWWWGNQPALKFWGLSQLDELINKDLSGDTQGARDRTVQTFELAAKNGLTIDPWTTYPDGKPKTLYMKHRAVLVGPERHRAIIAYINEEVNLGETPENLLLVEAMRYTTVMVTSFTFEGEIVIENPAATEAYNHIDPKQLSGQQSAFSARFATPAEGESLLQQAISEKGGRWTHLMRTSAGLRQHTLDIRITRHPLSGDFLILMAEYDVTPLYEALNEAHEAQEELREMAHYDAVSGLPSLNFLMQHAPNFLARAERSRQQLAVMFIDLDGFKTINDSWGHDTGDQVLREIALRLSGVLRDADQIARIGGDEFIILVDDIHDENSVTTVAEKIIHRLEEKISLKDSAAISTQVRVSASIGIALFPEHGKTLEQLIKVADKAMYHVKNSGKASYAIGNNPANDLTTD
ncbi:GGDEF domain-containing protein [Amphritea pacifica]|uniref:GGDEF domain-containing protein n=1 Tax=Amphritea pacifica TaxID=2811233 RepID=A0ABS2WBA8_9GAMM|nr:GGDEF domain-containing protein [Amphritea pacifica]MBN0988627.1 GGDEF domain-containing protein [Amphritea pacifica]